MLSTTTVPRTGVHCSQKAVRLTAVSFLRTSFVPTRVSTQRGC